MLKGVGIKSVVLVHVVCEREGGGGDRERGGLFKSGAHNA